VTTDPRISSGIVLSGKQSSVVVVEVAARLLSGELHLRVTLNSLVPLGSAEPPPDPSGVARLGMKDIVEELTSASPKLYAPTSSGQLALVNRCTAHSWTLWSSIDLREPLGASSSSVA
jgi:hypothetical protein